MLEMFAFALAALSLAPGAHSAALNGGKPEYVHSICGASREDGPVARVFYYMVTQGESEIWAGWNTYLYARPEGETWQFIALLDLKWGRLGSYPPTFFGGGLYGGPDSMISFYRGWATGALDITAMSGREPGGSLARWGTNGTQLLRCRDPEPGERALKPGEIPRPRL